MLPFHEFEKRYLKNPESHGENADIDPIVLEQILSIHDLDDIDDDQLELLIAEAGGVEKFMEVRSFFFESESSMTGCDNDFKTGDRERTERVNRQVDALARAFVKDLRGKLDMKAEEEAPTAYRESTASTVNTLKAGGDSCLPPEEEVLVGVALGQAVIELLQGELNNRRTIAEAGSSDSTDLIAELSKLIALLDQRRMTLVAECSTRQQAIYWLRKLGHVPETELSRRLGITSEQLQTEQSAVVGVLQRIKHQGTSTAPGIP